ncbi:Chitinase 2 [Didymosphaeria variabile]|uniref:chitinase n=1 Tax=Didymosphaeria variabile TaxID=1932322 RepID=A0A9W8XN94_9PLEO|nr:Chitinase 2 [Didymosphaeria variabile]KAJ4355534.1 Chitinase 2 [Didymosphaeria variabile]
MGLFASFSIILAAAASVRAGYNAASKSNVVLYWGQNSAGQQSTQSRLSTYCDANVDVLLLSFLLRFSGTNGQPILNFANAGDNCTLFAGTETFNCPQIAYTLAMATILPPLTPFLQQGLVNLLHRADIKTCQGKGKTIMLSIGGDSYNEGGFTSAALATAAADKIWAMFGPVQSSSGALRPFADSVLDGFDFDFEANVSNMATFANQLRTRMNAATGKRKDILTNVPLDWVNVQFYNNYCATRSYTPGTNTQNNFNFQQWDTWAKASKNPAAKVLLGVPANTGAAGAGYYQTATALQPVIQYSAQFSSFGGVMMWDASQAWTNPGFVASIKSFLTGLKKRQMRWGLRQE